MDSSNPRERCISRCSSRGWTAVNDEVRWLLEGGEFPKSLVRVVDHLRYPVPGEHPGWSSD